MQLAHMEMGGKRAEALKELLHELTWELSELVDFMVDRRAERKEIEADEKDGTRSALLRTLGQCLGNRELLTIPLCVEIADGFEKTHRSLYIETIDDPEREALRSANGKLAAPAAPPRRDPAPVKPALTGGNPNLPAPPNPNPKGPTVTSDKDIKTLRAEALKAVAAEKNKGWTEVANAIFPNDKTKRGSLMSYLSRCSLGKGLLSDERAAQVARVLGVTVERLTVRPLTEAEQRRAKMGGKGRSDSDRPATTRRGGARKAAGKKSDTDLNVPMTLTLNREEIAGLLDSDDTTVTAEIRGDRIHIQVEADVTLKALFAMKAKD